MTAPVTTPQVIVLRLPLPLNLANSRLHWATKDRKRVDYHMRATVAAMLQGNQRPAEPWERARISAAFRVHSLCDVDNLFARLKWVADWLQVRGYIVNDSPRCLEWAGVPTQVVARKDQGVTVTLQKLELSADAGKPA